MRWVGWFVIAWMLAHGEVPGTVGVLYASPDAKAVRIATLKLKLALAENTELERKFHAEKLHIIPKRFGHFDALTVGPIRSQAVRNAVLLMFGSRFHGMFFVQESAAPPPVSHTVAARRTAPHEWAMQPIDWAWLMIFVLAIIGLAASMMQRKRLFVFKTVQTQFREHQRQMDHTIDLLKKGEQ